MTRIDRVVSSRKRNIIIAIIMLTVVVLSLYFIKSILVDKKQQTSLQTPLPVSVIIDKVNAQLWGTELAAVGTVQSFEGITVKAQIAGRITQMVGQSGTVIKQGEPLFQINPEVLKAQLAEAQAQLESSQFEYQRLQTLYKKGAVSEEKLIQAKSQYHNDEAALATMEQQLALASNLADFDGVLGLTQVEVGDEVAIGDVLATLQSQARLRVEFSVPQKYRTRIKVGDDVNVMRELIHQAELGDSVPNVNDVPHHYVAKVYAIEPLIDENTRTVTLRAEIDAQALHPGSYVDVILQLNDKKKVLTVPETALMTSLYGDFIYLVVDDKAKKVPVNIGRRRNASVELLTGVKEGDTIIRAGLRKVSNGRAVKPSTLDAINR